MNLELFNVATQGVASVGAFLIREDQDSLNKNGINLLALTDEELRARCLEAIRGEDTNQLRKDEGLLPAITSLLGWFERRTSSLTIRRLALAVEAFKRAPADLAPGSVLFPQQIQAAVSLTRRCLIQMDTGEGKTYALLPAAFALACEYHRVYIVCANEYLAWRDAKRTRTFWEFTGLPISLCLDYDDDWSGRIIYTTLNALVFQHMRNLVQMEQPSESLTFGAVLIDEADAILLDQGDQSFTLIENIKAEAFDWSFALQYADTLKPEEIEIDYSDLGANLTVAGETRLRETLGHNTFQESAYLLTRFAVELAYVGVKVAIEDRDYIVEDSRIYAVDATSGKVSRNITPHWVIPLEIQKGFQPRSESITLDEITTLTLLTKFQHWSGLSGTIADDALEYLFLYLLPTLVIRPRKKRQQGVWPDLIYRTAAEANDALCEEVLKAIEANRPVLIGTQTIADAEKIYLLLSAKLPPGVRLELLTGKNDYDAAQVFERGGEVGSVIVATQLAGRGVDIRLSESARRNGGLSLFCRGRSRTIRHDKQFLGRAGRQGDPFSARFICSLQDDLFRIFAGEKVNKLMGALGMEHGVAIESSMVTRRVIAAQNSSRRAIFWANQHQALLSTSSSEIRASIETWFDYLQLSDTDEADTIDCSQEFLAWVIDFYVKDVLDGILPSHKRITLADADQITAFLNDSLGLLEHQSFSTLDFEERDVESATSILRELLLKKLQDASAGYKKIRAAATNSLWQPTPETDDQTDNKEYFFSRISPTAYAQFQTINTRTPRRIAFWSVRSLWIGFLQERRRIIHRAYQKRLSYLEHYRMITDQVTNEWQKTEREIAIKVLRNLLRSAQPSTLDDLFVYEDNKATDIAREKEFPFMWEAGSNQPTDTFDPKKNVQLLIGQFAAQAVNALSDSFTVSHLRRLLVDFAEENPLYMLQSPAKIQKALESWNAAEDERGVSIARRKLHKKWLRLFLLFLRERKLVGGLPTLQTRLQSTLTKFIKTITETRTALTYIGLTAFVTLFTAVTYWGTFAQPKRLGPFGAALDTLFFAGLLSQGNIAAPSFGTLIIAHIVVSFVFPQTADTPKDANLIHRSVVLLLQVLFAWWLTDWHYGQMTLASVLRSLSVFFSILIVAMITKRVVWLLESRLGISLIAGWIGFSLLYAFLPTVHNAFATQVPILVFISISAVYCFWQYFNAHEIELVSTLLESTSTSMRVEEISGSLKVKADCGVAPHAYGLLSAWLLYSFLTSPALSQRLSLSSYLFIFILATVYFLIGVAIIVQIMNRRFSFEMWQMDLNARHQMIKDAHTSDELENKLTRIKQLLLRRELAFQVLIVLGAFYLLRGVAIPDTTFPFSLLVVFAAFLFGVTSRSFALQLYKLLYNRVPMGIEVLDLSKADEKTAKRTTWQKVKSAAKIIFAILIAVYGFLEIVSNTYEIWQKLKLFR